MDGTLHEREDYGPGLLRSLWRFRRLVLATTVAAAALGGLFSLSQPTVYQATAQIVLAAPDAGAFTGEGTRTEEMEAHVLVQAQRVTSSSVLARAAARLGDRGDPDALAGSVLVEPDVEISSIFVTGTATGAGEAARVANAVVDAYESVAAADIRADADAALERLEQIRRRTEATVRSLTGPGAGADQRSSRSAAVQRLVDLSIRADEIRSQAALLGDGIRWTERASVPQAPVQPRPLRDALLLGVFGLALGGVLAFWLAGRGESADAPGEAATALRAPLLGEIPSFRAADPTVPHLGHLETEIVEAYQFVVVNVEAALDGGGRTVLVVSPASGDGRTTTTRLLAEAMAANGSRVVAVDADARTKGLTALVDGQRHAGLTELASGEVPVEECLLPFDGDSRASPLLLPVGRRPRSAPGFLRGTAFRETLGRVAAGHDLVMVDTPPMSDFTDGFAMADDVDGIVVVVRRGTSLAELERLRDRLSLNVTPILGYVFNRSATGDGHRWAPIPRLSTR